jgi:hypothetical protein
MFLFNFCIHFYLNGLNFPGGVASAGEQRRGGLELRWWLNSSGAAVGLLHTDEREDGLGKKEMVDGARVMEERRRGCSGGCTQRRKWWTALRCRQWRKMARHCMVRARGQRSGDGELAGVPTRG